LFGPAFVAGYWLTNVAGLMLLARGATEAATGKPVKLKRQLLSSLAIATGYTVAVLLLIRTGVLRPLF
jgi:hypothetical protein